MQEPNMKRKQMVASLAESHNDEAQGLPRESHHGTMVPDAVLSLVCEQLIRK